MLVEGAPVSASELHRYESRLLPMRFWASPCYPWASVFPFVKWVSDSFHGFQRLALQQKENGDRLGVFLKTKCFCLTTALFSDGMPS